MPLFKVWAKATTFYTIEVEADTREQAEDKAACADSIEFDCLDGGSGDWDILPEWTEVPDPQCEGCWIEIDQEVS